MVHENSFIDCDDSGVEFIVARVQARLSRVIENANMEELKKLVPFESSHNSNSILLIKVNIFDCGGIAIGASLSHKIGDSGSLVTFMNAWAAYNSRTKSDTKSDTKPINSTEYQPDFDQLAHYFPPNENLYGASKPHPSNVEITTRRLVFDGEKLEKLKKVQSANSAEAVSAFIWKNIIWSNKVISGMDKAKFAALYGVNLKPRTIPPILDNAFGNCGTFAITPTCETTDSIEDLRSKISLAASEINNSYIKNMLSDHVGHFKVLGKIGEFYNSGTNVFNFADMSWVPIYDTDFGWGKPDWACATTIPNMNLTYMLSTPSGDGIEAWINLHDGLFQLLESSYKGLSFL